MLRRSSLLRHTAGLAAAVTALLGLAQVPSLLHHQGRIVVGDVLFDGPGRFKFALVNADGSQAWWRNAPDGDADGEPDAAVEIPVNRGLYALLLGDTRLANMAALPPAALAAGEAYLRVWFSDGTGPFERLAPDHQLAAAGYALVARTVEDGAITATKLAPGAITPAQVPALDATKITSGRLDAARLPAGVAFQADVAGLQTALTALSARVLTLESGGGGGGSGGIQASREPADPVLLAAGFERFTMLAGPAWRAGSTSGSPSARTGHSAVWTGAEWLIWGGQIDGIYFNNDGRSYPPVTDSWSGLVNVAPVPEPRTDHSAVWTGVEMIVWGGRTSSGFLATGGRYVPAENRWHATGVATSGAPAARADHMAAWCAGRMLIWGGRNATGLLQDGGLYDPATDSWAELPLAGAPVARHQMAMVVAENTVFLWGGQGDPDLLGDGAALVLNPDGTVREWRRLSDSGAPSPRRWHTAVWTGSRLIIWGGLGAGDAPLGDGKAYDPAADTWEDLPTAGAPSPRAGHNALWTGTEMLIVAGANATGPLAAGGAYHPVTRTWRTLTSAGNPTPRHAATAVWTGNEVLIFGGLGGASRALGALERLDPAGDWHLFRKP
jgi:hypothetical protein